MKGYLNKLSAIWLFCLTSMFCACSSEDLTGTSVAIRDTDGWNHAKVRLNVERLGFDQQDGSTRALDNQWKDGDVIYILLIDKSDNKVQAYVKYDSSKQAWGDIIYDGYKSNLSCGTERVAEAYYIEGVSTLGISTLNVSNDKAIYVCMDGSYVYPADGDMTLTIALKPLTGRIRFEGNAGTTASISGIKTYNKFSVTTGKLTESTESVNTMVTGNGFTPYIYCSFADEEAPSLMVTTDKTYKTIFDPSLPILQAGKSGFLSLPTAADHRGWLPYVFVSNISLNPVSLSLEEDESTTIIASFEPVDATNKGLIWTSSNPLVATVDDIGMVTAIGVGRATIMAVSKDNNLIKDECSVEVTDINGYEYVDLGLTSGTMWATMNVGATKVGEYGDYYSWGDICGYNNYVVNWDGFSFSWKDYPWCDGTDSFMKKYCVDPKYGDVDNITELEHEDDAAWENWGHSWQMPTQVQFNELRNQCTWTWTIYDGIYGYKVSSKKNSNSIFLPAAGRRTTYLESCGTYGFYWSSSLGNSYGDYACELTMASDRYVMGHTPRCDGLSIRPVLNKQ